jgi:hypothetical protein
MHTQLGKDSRNVILATMQSGYRATYWRCVGWQLWRLGPLLSCVPYSGTVPGQRRLPAADRPVSTKPATPTNCHHKPHELQETRKHASTFPEGRDTAHPKATRGIPRFLQPNETKHPRTLPVESFAHDSGRASVRYPKGSPNTKSVRRNPPLQLSIQNLI